MTPRTLWATVAVLTVGAVAAFVVAMWPSTPSAQAQQLARTSQACQMWAATAQPPSTWCSDMRGWMRSQLAHRSVQGTMMWATPAAMRDSCRRWLLETGHATDATRCDDMVAWMTGHSTDWSGWMMHRAGMMGGN